MLSSTVESTDVIFTSIFRGFNPHQNVSSQQLGQQTLLLHQRLGKRLGSRKKPIQTEKGHGCLQKAKMGGME